MCNGVYVCVCMCAMWYFIFVLWIFVQCNLFMIVVNVNILAFLLHVFNLRGGGGGCNVCFSVSRSAPPPPPYVYQCYLFSLFVSILGNDWVHIKLQAPVYNILPSTTAVFSYAIGSRKLSANEQFFIGAQTVVSLLQTTQIISDICFIFFITNHTAYASWNKTKIVWIETELFFCNWGGCVSCLHACLGTRLLPQSYQYPDLLEGADLVGGQLRRDRECPFSGVTKSGRVWRRVPESDAWSVGARKWSSCIIIITTPHPRPTNTQHMHADTPHTAHTTDRRKTSHTRQHSHPT